MPSPPWQQHSLLLCFLFGFYCIYFLFNRNVDAVSPLFVRSRPQISFRPDDFSQSMSESTGSVSAKTSYTLISLSHSTGVDSSAVIIPDSFNTFRIAKTDLDYTRETLNVSESFSLHFSDRKFTKNLTKRSVLSNSTTISTNTSHIALPSPTAENDSSSPIYTSLYDNSIVPNNDIATAEPLNIPRINVFGLFSDGDTIILRYSTDSVMFRCIACFNKYTDNGGYTGKGSRIALVIKQMYDPGRLSQFAVEVVSVDNSTRRAVIRLRTDDSTYVRAVFNSPWYNNPVAADTASPALNGTLWTIVPNSDGSFKMMDEHGEYLLDGGAIETAPGEAMSATLGFYSPDYALNFFPVHVNLTKDDLQQMTAPWLKSGALAPFAHGDVISISKAQGRMKYSPIVSFLNYSYYPSNVVNYTSVLAVSGQHGLDASCLVRAYYQGDPSDGIFRMYLLDGTPVYIGNQDCLRCGKDAYMVIANGTDHITDWQISILGYYGGWNVNAIANDGQKFATPLQLYISFAAVSGEVDIFTVGPNDSGEVNVERIPINQVNQILMSH